MFPYSLLSCTTYKWEINCKDNPVVTLLDWHYSGFFTDIRFMKVHGLKNTPMDIIIPVRQLLQERGLDSILGWNYYPGLEGRWAGRNWRRAMCFSFSQTEREQLLCFQSRDLEWVLPSLYDVLVSTSTEIYGAVTHTQKKAKKKSRNLQRGMLSAFSSQQQVKSFCCESQPKQGLPFFRCWKHGYQVASQSRS